MNKMILKKKARSIYWFYHIFLFSKQVQSHRLFAVWTCSGRVYPKKHERSINVYGALKMHLQVHEHNAFRGARVFLSFVCLGTIKFLHLLCGSIPMVYTYPFAHLGQQWNMLLYKLKSSFFGREKINK